MPGSSTKTTREQKLAAKLKENLRRRKAQARARAAGEEPAGDNAPAEHKKDANDRQ